MSDVPTRLLRETLGAAAPPDGSSACLDAETLAAWSDGTLRARERAAAESHASGCTRCQGLLAAMARSAPPAPAPARRWWRTSTFGWLVPIATGAAAVIIWFSLPTATRERAVARRPLPSRALAQTNTAPGPAAPTAERDRTPVASRPPVVAPRQPQPAEARADAASAAKAAAPQRAAAAETAPIDAAPLQAPAAVPPAAAPAPLLRERAMVDAALRGAGANAFVGVAGEGALIASPDPNVRWRLQTDGRVARSIDGGATWETQSTGIRATLTAGSAPSPTICWLVGPQGSIALTTDGRTWLRVAFPQSIDLASIRATDAAHATVRAVDGRAFTTADGGRTWRAE
jgi:hypothetical protein